MIQHNLENKLVMNVSVNLNILIMDQLYVKSATYNAKHVLNLRINAPHVILVLHLEWIKVKISFHVLVIKDFMMIQLKFVKVICIIIIRMFILVFKLCRFIN